MLRLFVTSRRSSIRVAGSCSSSVVGGRCNNSTFVEKSITSNRHHYYRNYYHQSTSNTANVALGPTVVAGAVGFATVAAVAAAEITSDDSSIIKRQQLLVLPILHQDPCLCESAFASFLGSFKRKNDDKDSQQNNTSDDNTDNTNFRIKKYYDIEQVLGEGAYGMVYSARRKSDGIKVALKTMPRIYTGKTDFEREVAALQKLSQPPSHDNIVKLIDLHRDENNYYLAMELIEGGELFEHLVQNGPYSEALASVFVRQFAEALCYVHSSGYTHADLKPENLMLTIDDSKAVTKDGTPIASLKMVDFGCACTHDQTRTDMLLPAQEFAMGCSFLHQVALGNQFELQRILQDRPNLVNFRDYDKRTALHIAASEGHLDICRFLVERGASINRVDRWGGSPLDDAHRHKHTKLLQFLGERGGKFGKTAVMVEKFITAASQGDVDEVKALLKFGNEIDINQGDYDSRTALHLAANEGRVTIVKLLCEAGANVHVKDRWGNTPFHDAKRANKNSTEIIKILKKYGTAGTNNQSQKKKQSNNTDSVAPQMKGEQEKLSGTIAYSPPELFAKGAMPTPASDMWAAGVIVYVLLTGSHPFDKYGATPDHEIRKTLIEIGKTAKIKDGEQNKNLMDEIVFDERIEGLSESSIDLMKQLMNPDPVKRMTSDDFRRHPWVQGLTASWKNMANGFENLEATIWQNKFRAEIIKKFAPSLGIGDGDKLTEQDFEAMFRALDVKQKGVLELDEITLAFRDMDIPDKNIRDIFACADLDGSGVIRWDEFRALMTSINNAGNDGNNSNDNGPGLQVRYLQDRFKTHIMNRFGKRQLREIFNAIDLEGNGVLDPHEIRVVLRSAGEPEDVISKIVASLDIDHDGGVSWSEFQAVMGVTEDD